MTDLEAHPPMVSKVGRLNRGIARKYRIQIFCLSLSFFRPWIFIQCLIIGSRQAILVSCELDVTSQSSFDPTILRSPCILFSLR
jgi:hypothetical protein